MISKIGLKTYLTYNFKKYKEILLLEVNRIKIQMTNKTIRMLSYDFLTMIFFAL